jgi:hypothetical protein
MTTQETVYKNSSFGKTVPRGNRSALTVVDLTYGFSDTQYPTASDMNQKYADAIDAHNAFVRLNDVAALQTSGGQLS